MMKRIRERKIKRITLEQVSSHDHIEMEMLSLLNTSLMGLQEIGRPSSPTERASAELLKDNFKYAMGELNKKFEQLAKLSEREEDDDDVDEDVECICIDK